MSSHHVVREKQEPALLVLGMDSFDDELLGQLLEWSPTVIVTQNTAEKVHAWGIKIDCVISTDNIEGLQSDIKWLPAGTDTLTEAALKYLITNNYPAVNIITDDVQLKDVMYFADKINLVIFSAGKKIYAVNSGFTKWKPTGEVIELLAHPNELHTGGLESINNNCYKTTHDGFFSLRFDQPFIFIAEEIG